MGKIYLWNLIESNLITTFNLKECNCKSGWGGILCDEKLDYCEKNPNTCENGGLCKSLLKEDGSFKCECPSGFKGDRCDRNTMTTQPLSSTTSVPMNFTTTISPLSTIRIIPVNSFVEEPILSSKTTKKTLIFAEDDDENETWENFTLI